MELGNISKNCLNIWWLSFFLDWFYKIWGVSGAYGFAFLPIKLQHNCQTIFRTFTLWVNVAMGNTDLSFLVVWLRRAVSMYRLDPLGPQEAISFHQRPLAWHSLSCKSCILVFLLASSYNGVCSSYMSQAPSPQMMGSCWDVLAWRSECFNLSSLVFPPSVIIPLGSEHRPVPNMITLQKWLLRWVLFISTGKVIDLSEHVQSNSKHVQSVSGSA